MNIAIIAESDQVLAFRALGFLSRKLERGQSLSELVQELAEAGAGVIFISSSLGAKNPAVFTAYQAKCVPALIPLPLGEAESANFGLERLRSLVRKAVGLDLLGHKESN